MCVYVVAPCEGGWLTCKPEQLAAGGAAAMLQAELCAGRKGCSSGCCKVRAGMLARGALQVTAGAAWQPEPTRVAVSAGRLAPRTTSGGGQGKSVRACMQRWVGCEASSGVLVAERLQPASRLHRLCWGWTGWCESIKGRAALTWALYNEPTVNRNTAMHVSTTVCTMMSACHQ